MAASIVDALQINQSSATTATGGTKANARTLMKMSVLHTKNLDVTGSIL